MSSITSPAQPQPNDFQENYLIVGLGRSGLSSAKYLAKYETTFGKTINISSYDKFKNINEQKKILKGLNVKNFYTGDIKAEYCTKGSYIVLSPGIDFNEIEEITQGNKVVNDIFLFLKYIEKKHNATRNLKIIGVTGTNGKTTTCSFLEHLYNKLGINVKLAGNIGLSPLDLIDELDNVEIIILEISSFQLMPFIEKALPVKLDVGIFLNLTPDHLDVHKDMAEYTQAKLTLLSSSKRTIVNRNLDKSIISKFNDISFGESLKGDIKNQHNAQTLKKYRQHFQYDRQYIFDDQGFKVSVEELKIPGQHNILNIMAGIAAFTALGGSTAQLASILSEFKGIPHRMEWITKIDDVEYFNDSKATNIASTLAALACFNQKKNIILIAGGDSKNQSLLLLSESMKKFVSHLLLIGKDAELFVESFKDLDSVEIVRCHAMEDAVNKAYLYAKKNDVILLSPACASFDMYKNYAERGNHFKALVGRLIP